MVRNSSQAENYTLQQAASNPADGEPEEGGSGTPKAAPTGSPSLQVVPVALAGQRVDQALARLFPEYSRSRLAEWLQAGHIQVEGRSAKAAQKVWGGERIELLATPGAGGGTDAPEDIALSIVHEDAAVLVVDKPAGLVVHPGSGNRQGTLLNALLHHAPALAEIPRAGIVHRLDKDTSGLLVVARTLTAQTDLVRQLQARSVTRQYLAVVHGEVAAGGEVDAPIGRDPGNRVRMAVVGSGKEARTRYRVLERFGAGAARETSAVQAKGAGAAQIKSARAVQNKGSRATLLECSLDTGRTHQIRVHMQKIGHPLLGDPVYRANGAPTHPALAPFARQALHAARLAFVHPDSGQTLRFEAPLPDDMRELIDRLRSLK